MGFALGRYSLIVLHAFRGVRPGEQGAGMGAVSGKSGMRLPDIEELLRADIFDGGDRFVRLTRILFD